MELAISQLASRDGAAEKNWSRERGDKELATGEVEEGQSRTKGRVENCSRTKDQR